MDKLFKPFLCIGLMFSIFVFVLFNGNLSAQQKIIPKKLQQIENHVYLFQGGGNWALTSLILEDEDGLILIDTHFSDENNELLISEIKRTFPQKKVKTIVISHPHADHFMGIRFFQEAFGNMEVISIAGEKEHMEKTADILYAAYQEVSPNQKIGLNKIVYPNKEIAGDFELSFYDRVAKFELLDQNESWKSWVLYLPDSKLLYMGDLYWGGLTLDMDGFGASLIGWEKELRNVMNREIGIIIPGHGVGLHNRKTVDDFIYNLSAFIQTGKGLIQNGMSRDDFINDEFHKNIVFFGGREANLGWAYDELKTVIK